MATPPPDTIRNVETFATGEYPGDNEGEVWKYADRDLSQIVRNFDALSKGPNPTHRVPVVVTHDGTHAAGWVKATRKDGELLLTDWSDVSPDLQRAITNKRLLKVSAEVKKDFTDKDSRVTPGHYLYRVAVLGADVPRVKGLADIPANKFADGQPGRRIERKLKFSASGKTTMDRASAIQILADAGVDPSILTDQIPDEVLIAIATAMQGGTDDGSGNAVDHADDNPSEDDEEGNGYTQRLPSSLVGFDDPDDPDDDDQLPKPARDDMGDPATRGHRQISHRGGGGRTGTPRRQPKRKVTIQQFADPKTLSRFIAREIGRQTVKATRTIAAATQAETKAREARAREERLTETRMFCDRQTAAGRLSVADNDEGSPTSVRSRLLRIAAQPQTVHRFADPADKTGVKQIAKTELQLQQEEIERREVRRFAEKFRTGADGQSGADPFRDRAKNHYDNEMKRLDHRTGRGAGSRN
jgi:hypothetical protein